MMGGGDSGGTTTTVQKAEPWAAIQPALTDASTQIKTLGDQLDLTPYPGQTFAPMNPLTQYGLSHALTSLGDPRYSELTGNMLDNTNRLMQGDPMANPYMGAMSQSLINDAGRYLSDTALPQLRDQFNASGTLGSSRHALATGEAIGRTGEGLSDALANLYGNSYESAQDRALKGLMIAPQLYNLPMQQAQPYMQIGETLRNEDQNAIDESMWRYNAEKTQPQNEYDWYLQRLLGLAGLGSTMTGTSTGPSAGGGGLGSSLGGGLLGYAAGSGMAAPGALASMGMTTMAWPLALAMAFM